MPRTNGVLMAQSGRGRGGHALCDRPTGTTMPKRCAPPRNLGQLLPRFPPVSIWDRGLRDRDVSGGRGSNAQFDLGKAKETSPGTALPQRELNCNAHAIVLGEADCGAIADFALKDEGVVFDGLIPEIVEYRQ